MVKGITRRIVMVESTKESIFEQAIFIVKDEVYKTGVPSAEKVIDEAGVLALKCLNPTKIKKARIGLCTMLSAAFGGLFVAGLWLLSIIIFH